MPLRQEILSGPLKGYKAYIYLHKRHKRYYAHLYPVDRSSGLQRRTMSWARCLMTMHLNRELNSHETVDHINNNKTDDRIENFQLLSRAANTSKAARGRTLICLVCPECGKPFRKERRDTNLVRGKTRICCSTKCGRKRGGRKRRKV